VGFSLLLGEPDHEPAVLGTRFDHFRVAHGN
jgi:hypothetical protein